MRVISKAISLSNAPSLTDEELLIRAKDWGEELVEIVPESELPDVFRRAVKDHTSTFPVNFYDLKLAYDSLQKDRQQNRLSDYELQKYIWANNGPRNPESL